MKKEVHSRLALRKLTTDDVEFMMELRNNPETVRYIPWLIQDAETMTAWVNSLKNTEHEFIVLIDGIVPIGECSLSVAGDIAEIGIMLKPEYCGKGYGTEVMLMLEMIAKTLDLHKLTALTDTNNRTMVHIFEKLGFQMNAVACGLKMPEADEQAEPERQWMALYEKTIST